MWDKGEILTFEWGAKGARCKCQAGGSPVKFASLVFCEKFNGVNIAHRKKQGTGHKGIRQESLEAGKQVRGAPR
jgi:hypothetical protein